MLRHAERDTVKTDVSKAFCSFKASVFIRWHGVQDLSLQSSILVGGNADTQPSPAGSAAESGFGSR